MCLPVNAHHTFFAAKFKIWVCQFTFLCKGFQTKVTTPDIINLSHISCLVEHMNVFFYIKSTSASCQKTFIDKKIYRVINLYCGVRYQSRFQNNEKHLISKLSVETSFKCSNYSGIYNLFHKVTTFQSYVFIGYPVYYSEFKFHWLFLIRPWGFTRRHEVLLELWPLLWENLKKFWTSLILPQVVCI